jgi:flagellar basal body L-ring protein FlgH
MDVSKENTTTSSSERVRRKEAGDEGGLDRSLVVVVCDEAENGEATVHVHGKHHTSERLAGTITAGVTLAKA